MPDSVRNGTETTAEPDLTGQQLGDYRLLRRLGRGAMAEVYLAQQQSLRRQVAFKVLKLSLAGDENYVRRFHNEAQAAAALVHANIVQIHEVGQIDGTHFIVQEYVPGQNLKQYLASHGAMDVPLAVAIMRQVTAALHKAGQQGIVHRDIKPDNIMLSTAGEVKVADFGLARLTGDDQALTLTQVGTTMGTPLYMSPEQAEGKSLDPRSDIYSLGVTCYHMLAGRPPFYADTALAVAVQHLKSEPQNLETTRADLPGDLCRIVHRMLAKNPNERYQDAVELMQDLRTLSIEGLDESWSAALENLSGPDLTTALSSRSEVTQRLDALMKTSSMKTVRTRKKNWLIGMAAIALMVAFLLGGLLAWARREPPLLKLTNKERAELVDRRDTVQAQYIFAMMLNSEKSWQSVWQYFPEEDSQTNKYYARQAKLQLARLYLQPDHKNPRRALSLFDELASLDQTQQRFRAHGMAGQAIVYNLRGEYQRSAAALADLAPLRIQLDAELVRELERISRVNRRELKARE